MASSRWKRFGFFDRHTLNLPSAVVDDLLPETALSGSGRRLMPASSELLQHIDNDLCVKVTTAGLPSVITDGGGGGGADGGGASLTSTLSDGDDTVASVKITQNMASSLTACGPMANESIFEETVVKLPGLPTSSNTSRSRAGGGVGRGGKNSNDNNMDGLVLTFISSVESDLIHCVDVTVRCSTTKQEEKLDLDGWRGYWAPFPYDSTTSGATGTTTTTTTGSSTRSSAADDRIIVEHLRDAAPVGSGGGDAVGGGGGGERIVGLATARDVNGKLLVAVIADQNVVLQVDPHLHLSCRLPINISASLELSTSASFVSTRPHTIPLASPWNTSSWGHCTSVDIVYGGAIGNTHVAVGTDTGRTIVFSKVKNVLRQWMVIPPPGTGQGLRVANLQMTLHTTGTVSNTSGPSNDTDRGGGTPATAPKPRIALFVSQTKAIGGSALTAAAGGLFCYDLGLIDAENSPTAPLARHDLDSRPAFLVDPIWQGAEEGLSSSDDSLLMVARPDGLYTYSQTQKVTVAPVDGTKLAICAVPSLTTTTEGEATSAYSLVASTDLKSGRDAVDIYDASNKLVAFHVLLSPGHRALRACGIRSRGGRSSAVVITSGGSVVTLTEKETDEKVSLLVQKNLYGAAISMAYADASYSRTEITNLYCRHAEHLYRKGDFAAAMDQYVYTIGSLESSHVILRYLDAPKIPFLAKYLEELRKRQLATPVHNELLRTCYLKLNDNEAADKLLAQRSAPGESAVETISNLTHNPKEALATLCTLEAPQAAEALVVHGAALARAAPKETAGIVVSLCVGTYSPSALAETAKKTEEASRLLEYAVDERTKKCEPYPVHMFTSAFLENPKILRLVLQHCNRNKCYLTPTLRRTLLELTLDEWKAATRNGDTEAEKLRRKEAITALTDAHCHDIGDYDALVIVQLVGFAEGELLLYERLQMVPMLLARYAQDGGDRARRQMLAMCRKDPEILADVLGHFVNIASEKIDHDRKGKDDDSVRSEEEEILDDIRETLALARSQGVLPPVRIARILAGEGVGQFSTSTNIAQQQQNQKNTVPLSVALDYVGEILDESRREIGRLRGEVEEYNDLCMNMESEIEALLASSGEKGSTSPNKQIDIEEMYANLRTSMEDPGAVTNSRESRTLQAREAFWREMNQSDDRFETICKFFAKGIIQ